MGCLCLAVVGCHQQESATPVLRFEDFAHYIEEFNQSDEELYRQHISNAQAASFLEENIPLIDLPDAQLEKIYYFRWWTFRKHLRSTPNGFVITEFLPPVSWAGKYNTINCPAGHHLYEARWLRDDTFAKDYLRFWLTESGQGLRRYSFWMADAARALMTVHPDVDWTRQQLPGLVENYRSWEEERRDAGRTLFWQIDNLDGMEFSVSGRLIHGGWEASVAAVRPTINSYMYGDAQAIGELARWVDDADLAQRYATKAQEIKGKVQERLWHDSLQFFTVLPRDFAWPRDPLPVRELIGYTPWYFGLPDDRPIYAGAWDGLMDTATFYAPFGLTVCEQSHPYFQISYEGHECQWNGPSWPFATTVTLKALSRFLNEYSHLGSVQDTMYQHLLRQYAGSHALHHEDGRRLPWIDENLNPYTGDWIARTRLKTWDGGTWSSEKGGRERGKDYNHSGFCDLIIADLIGLKPSLDDRLRLQPLVPEEWDYFCLDRLRYHGRDLTVLWDRDGLRYGRGDGLRIFVDGQEIYAGPALGEVLIELL